MSADLTPEQHQAIHLLEQASKSAPVDAPVTDGEVERMLDADAQPVAWIHTMYLEFGQTIVRVTLSAAHPFGEPKRDYSPEYEIVSVPLYAHPSPAKAQGDDAPAQDARNLTRDEQKMLQGALFKSARVVARGVPVDAPAQDVGELDARLMSVRERVGKMCSEGRPPNMRIPADPNDDDIFICDTMRMVAAELTRLRAALADAERYRIVQFEREYGPDKTHFRVFKLWTQPHSETGEPVVWQQALHGTALDAAIDATKGTTP